MVNNTPYLLNPAGLIFFKHGQGWFLSKLNEDGNLKIVIGPLGQKNNILKEAFNYFIYVYLIDEKCDIHYIEENNQNIVQIENSIENLETAKQNAICLLKTEKIKNHTSKS